MEGSARATTPANTTLAVDACPPPQGPLFSLPFAVLLFVISRLLERYCFIPLGKYESVNPYGGKPDCADRMLEEAYGRQERVSHVTVVVLAESLGWTERQVERWLRQRRRHDRAANVTQFVGSGWPLPYYTAEVVFVWFILWDQPWDRLLNGVVC